MSPEKLRAARNRYRYVPAHLIESINGEPDLIWGNLRLVRKLPSRTDWENAEIRKCYASVGIDSYHAKLLNQNTERALLHGLASTVFWGYASGLDGRYRIERAIAKTRMLIEGRQKAPAQSRYDILQHLRDARD